MKLYFAAPLFCDSERVFNSRLTIEIEALGYEVFLPQRDGLESDQTLESMGAEAWSQAIFDLDCDQVMDCDVLLCILDGRVPDEGMGVEIGLAYADRHHANQHRKLIGYTTDFRVFSPAGLNAMLAGALDEVLHDEDALLARLGEIIASK
jgi:nucleoside 2-deoxyribosyltransferase